MYDGSWQKVYRGGMCIVQRGSSTGSASTIFERPATPALQPGALQGGRRGQAKTTPKRGSKPNETPETTEGVESVVNSPDSEAFSAKTQGRSNEGYGDKQRKIRVYLGVSRARAPQGDRRALYGIPNEGD